MGNKCIITTDKNLKSNGIGIYLHWNGDIDSVAAFLKYCKLHRYRKPENDNYGFAMLTNVITNFFGNGLSCGVGLVNNLDDSDNGIYVIKDWEIFYRKANRDISAEKVNKSHVAAMVKAIDSYMPEHMKLYKT